MPKGIDKNLSEGQKAIRYMNIRVNAVLSKLDSLKDLPSYGSNGEYVKKMPPAVFDAIEKKIQQRLDKAMESLRNPEVAEPTYDFDVNDLLTSDLDDEGDKEPARTEAA